MDHMIVDGVRICQHGCRGRWGGGWGGGCCGPGAEAFGERGNRGSSVDRQELMAGDQLVELRPIVFPNDLHDAGHTCMAWRDGRKQLAMHVTTPHLDLLLCVGRKQSLHHRECAVKHGGRVNHDHLGKSLRT